jgi:hypothetical protein
MFSRFILPFCLLMVSTRDYALRSGDPPANSHPCPVNACSHDTLIEMALTFA